MERIVSNATEEEINAIKGVHRFDVPANEQAEAIKTVNNNYGIHDPNQAINAPVEPVKPVIELVVEPVKAVEPVKVEEPIKPVEPAKVEPVEKYAFTKEYIAEAKTALAEIKTTLGEAKFSELEESIKKGLDSPFFVKNAKGGYTAKENIADIALKAQGFVNVPTEAEKAAKVAALRETVAIVPSPVIDNQAPKGRSQKDLLKDLKSPDYAARKAAMYKLTGVDETMDLINGYMKRK
jgi:hypothetical protein